MARDAIWNRRTAQVLHKWLDRVGLESISRRSGITTSTLYHWQENKANVPIWALERLAQAMPAEVRAEFALEITGLDNCGLGVHELVKPQTVADIRDRAIAVGAEVGKAQALVSEALRDEWIDHAEEAEIRRQLQATSAAIAELGEAVRTH